MKKTFLVFSLLANLLCLAGQEVGNGGSIIIKGQEYFLADTEVTNPIPFDRFELGTPFIEKLNSIKDSLAQEFSWDLSLFFQQEVLAPEVHFRFVEQLPASCEGQNLMGCTRGRISYILRDSFIQLGFLKQCLKLIELRLLLYSSLDGDRAHPLIEQLYQTLNLLFEKVIYGTGSSLTDEELATLGKLKELFFAIVPQEILLSLEFKFNNNGTYQVIELLDELPPGPNVDFIYVDGRRHLLSETTADHLPQIGRANFGPKLLTQLNYLAQAMDELHLPLGVNFLNQYIFNGDYQFVSSFDGLNCQHLDLNDLEDQSVELVHTGCTVGTTTYLNPFYFSKLTTKKRALLIYHERSHVIQSELATHNRIDKDSETMVMNVINGMDILVNKFWDITYRRQHRTPENPTGRLSEDQMNALRELPRFVSGITGNAEVMNGHYDFTLEGGVLINSDRSDCQNCIIGFHTVVDRSGLAGSNIFLVNSKLVNVTLLAQEVSIRSSNIQDTLIGYSFKEAHHISILYSKILNSEIKSDQTFLTDVQEMKKMFLGPNSSHINISGGFWDDVKIRNTQNFSARRSEVKRVSFNGHDQDQVVDVELKDALVENSTFACSKLKIENAYVQSTALNGEEVELSGEISMINPLSRIPAEIIAYRTSFHNFIYRAAKHDYDFFKKIDVEDFISSGDKILRVRDSSFRNVSLQGFRFNYYFNNTDDEFFSHLRLEDVSLQGIEFEHSYTWRSLPRWKKKNWDPSIPKEGYYFQGPAISFLPHTEIRNIHSFSYERKHLVFGEQDCTSWIEGFHLDYYEEDAITPAGVVSDIFFMVGGMSLKHHLVDTDYIEDTDDLEGYLLEEK